jgi:hypothetical protein
MYSNQTWLATISPGELATIDIPKGSEWEGNHTIRVVGFSNQGVLWALSIPITLEQAISDTEQQDEPANKNQPTPKDTQPTPRDGGLPLSPVIDNFPDWTVAGPITDSNESRSVVVSSNDSSTESLLSTQDNETGGKSQVCEGNLESELPEELTAARLSLSVIKNVEGEIDSCWATDTWAQKLRAGGSESTQLMGQGVLFWISGLLILVLMRYLLVAAGRLKEKQEL